MNKMELIEAMAKANKLSKRDNEKALGAFIDVVGKELKKGGKVQLVGFGTFEVGKRSARTGIKRQPATRNISRPLSIPLSAIIIQASPKDNVKNTF